MAARLHETCRVLRANHPGPDQGAANVLICLFSTTTIPVPEVSALAMASMHLPTAALVVKLPGIRRTATDSTGPASA
jgi:hypothetical protein